MAFNGKFVANLAFFGSNQGVPVADILEPIDKPLEVLCSDACVVTNSEYIGVIENVLRLTGDSHFGLHAGEHLNLSAAGLIGQITQTSGTIKEAIEYCCEFANLGCSVLPITLVEHSDKYTVNFTPDADWKESSKTAFKHTVDGVMAFTIRELASLARTNDGPLAIHLPWNDISDESEYVRVLGAAVKLNQNEISVHLPKEYVEQPIVNADYDLLRLLVAHANSKSEQLQEQGFKKVVKQSVLNLIKPDFPTLEQVANHLNMSSRTLQRKLKTEGITYKQMISELRFDLAKDYLKNPDLSIKEISYLLNYAEPSAFIRSFKLLAGVTPNSYRSTI